MTNKQDLINNGTFCIFPWIHQHITTAGEVLPCCTANFETPLGNVNQNTIEVYSKNFCKDLYLYDDLNVLQFDPVSEIINGVLGNICYQSQYRIPAPPKMKTGVPNPIYSMIYSLSIAPRVFSLLLCVTVLS